MLSAALVAAAAYWPDTAAAHDHRVPRVRLISKKAWQRGRLQSFCWVTGDPGTGQACGAGPYRWPDRDRTPGGETAIVRIRKAQRPRNLRLTRWRKVDEKGSPVGGGNRVNHTLSTTRHNGKVVHEARFHLPDKPGHYYLEVYAMWPDVRSHQRQDATWNLHLKLR
jgi:hypothetical protein